MRTPHARQHRGAPETLPARPAGGHAPQVPTKGAMPTPPNGSGHGGHLGPLCGRPQPAPLRSASWACGGCRGLERGVLFVRDAPWQLQRPQGPSCQRDGSCSGRSTGRHRGGPREYEHPPGRGAGDKAGAPQPDTRQTPHRPHLLEGLEPLLEAGGQHEVAAAGQRGQLLPQVGVLPQGQLPEPHVGSHGRARRHPHRLGRPWAWPAGGLWGGSGAGWRACPVAGLSELRACRAGSSGGRELWGPALGRAHSTGCRGHMAEGGGGGGAEPSS